MQLAAQPNIEPGLPGGSADSGINDTKTSCAVEAIPFGRVVANSGNVLTLTLSGTFSSGTIDVDINGTAIAQVTYATSHLVTMGLIRDAIEAVLGAGTVEIGTGASDLYFVITSPTNTAVTVSNWSSSQGITATHTVNTIEDLCRLPKQNKITIQLAGAMVTGDTISGYINGSSNLLTTTFAANSTATTLAAIAAQIAAEPGIKSATVGTNNIVVLADDHRDVTAQFQSTTQAVTYVEDCTDTFLGISARQLTEAGTSTDAQFNAGDAVAIARKGRRWIESAAAMTPATAVYVRFAPTPAADRGKITDAAGSNPVVAKLWSAASPYKTTAAAALADIELNLP